MSAIAALLRKPMYVPETVKADVLLKRMQKRKQSLAVVVDDYGGDVLFGLSANEGFQNAAEANRNIALNSAVPAAAAAPVRKTKTAAPNARSATSSSRAANCRRVSVVWSSMFHLRS